jgi:uncharacterized phage protein gp47/JayE
VNASGTLGPGSSISVEFKADVAGAAANIAPNTTLYLWTPLVGITATNPPLTPSNTWITTAGADEEADGRLIARCLGRWSRLTYGNTDGAYIAWALEALPALTRVAIRKAAGDGTVVLIGATAVGPIDAGQITTIQDYVSGVNDGIGRRPMNDIFSAVGASVLTSPTLNITAYVYPSAQATAASKITAALIAYFGSIRIGGDKLVSPTVGYVLYSKIVDVVQEIPGVKSATFSISGNITLADDQIYVPTINVTPIVVQPT